MSTSLYSYSSDSCQGVRVCTKLILIRSTCSILESRSGDLSADSASGDYIICEKLDTITKTKI